MWWAWGPQYSYPTALQQGLSILGRKLNGATNNILLESKLIDCQCATAWQLDSCFHLVISYQHFGVTTRNATTNSSAAVQSLNKLHETRRKHNFQSNLHETCGKHNFLPNLHETCGRIIFFPIFDLFHHHSNFYSEFFKTIFVQRMENSKYQYYLS